MTVKELAETLNALVGLGDGDTPVFVSSDSEGNRIGRLHSIGRGESGDGEEGVVLWP